MIGALTGVGENEPKEIKAGDSIWSPIGLLSWKELIPQNYHYSKFWNTTSFRSNHKQLPHFFCNVHEYASKLELIANLTTVLTPPC